MKLHLHIISFNVPYPPDYGGVIDVFNKLRILHSKGVNITLHCFEYGRNRSDELKKYCQKVYYYPRKTGFLSQVSILPYIIYSRRSNALLENLCMDEHPILFEGLHSTYHLKNKQLKNRKKIVRAHNVEHLYYFKLFKAEKKAGKKLFFLFETLKLYFIEKRLKSSNFIAAISNKEYKYFESKYSNAFLLNAFHSSDKLKVKPGIGNYLLFHGNLSVPENIKAVNFLLQNVFSKIDFPVIIAGKDPGSTLTRKWKKYKNTTILSSPDQDRMKDLIQNAHAIILVSFQDTGTKLKLIESLFHGRHCIANNIIIGNSGLDELCEIGNSPAELIIQIKKILPAEFDQSMIDHRKRFLKEFSNEENANLLIEKIR